MYDEKMINDVREYLQGEVGEAANYLYDMGREWCRLYDLDELYDEYCCRQLDEIINLFVDAGMSASDYDNYFVHDGYVRDECDLEDDVWEALDDDDLIDLLIDYALNGKINASSSLLEIINHKEYSWDDVENALREHFRHFLEVEYNDLKENSIPLGDFADKCSHIADTRQVFGYLNRTKFCGISEDRYNEIINALETNSAWMYGVAHVARSHVGGGITFEKGIEMYLKVDSTWIKE